MMNLHEREITQAFSVKSYYFRHHYTGDGSFLLLLVALIMGNGDRLLTCISIPTIACHDATLVTDAEATRTGVTIKDNRTVPIEYNDGSGTLLGLG